MAGIMYEKDETAISRAILENDLSGLKSALEDGKDPHRKDRKGNTYLHYLCTMNRPYLIHVLVGTQIDLNAVNRVCHLLLNQLHGNTALHVTALQSECCHVGDLMAAGIDASIRNKDGKTAAEIPTKNSFWKTVFEKYEPGIFEAIDGHDVDKVLYLLNCWSRVDTLRNGQTLRQFAACRKFHDLVFLIDLHCHTMNSIYAALEGNPDKAWPFLSHNKCNVNHLNVACHSKHVLQEAIHLANVKLVGMICRSKVNTNVRVRLKIFLEAPLFFSVLNPQVNNDIMWTVLRSGCDFTLRDERGRNAAVYALDRWKGEVSYDVITFMMKNKLDVSQRDAVFVLMKGLVPKRPFCVMFKDTSTGTGVFGVTLRNVAQFYRRKDILTLIDKLYVKAIRTSNLAELERLCSVGYDSMLIYFNAQVRRLFRCIKSKSLDDVIKIIVDCRKQQLLINAKDKGGRSPIHFAILFWRFDVLRLLLERPGIDLNAQDNCGKTALHYAYCVEEEERTEFVSILTQAGVDDKIQDFTGHKASDYMGDVRGHLWLAKERKASYGMPRQLACVDKYEELYRMMKGKGKTLHHFNESVKRFKYPVPQLYSILSNLMPNYRDLLLAAMDHGKEDIAVRLVQLGNNLSVVSKVTIDPEKNEVKAMTVLQKAKYLGMEKLFNSIEKINKHKQDKLPTERLRRKNQDKSDVKRIDKVRKLIADENSSEDVLFEEEEVEDSGSEDEDDDDGKEHNDDDDDDNVSCGSFYSDNFDDEDEDDDY